MNSRLPIALVIAVVAVSGAAASGSEKIANFRARVDLVVLDVHVQAPQANVADLTAGDFVVTDEGVPQPIVYFESRGALPIAALLLVDRSQSMTGARLELAKAAAIAFAATLRPDDYISIVGFNNTAERVVPFTIDRTAVTRGLSGMSATGLTGLHEAIAVGLDDLAKFARGRKDIVRQVLVVLSDGEDTTRRLPFEDVRARARESGAIVYVVSSRTDARDRPLPAGHAMTSLALDTGGRAIVPASFATLSASFEDISHELQQLYRIGFEPKAIGSGWRRLSVHVNRPGVRARTRAGYVAQERRRITNNE